MYIFNCLVVVKKNVPTFEARQDGNYSSRNKILTTKFIRLQFTKTKSYCNKNQTFSELAEISENFG